MNATIGTSRRAAVVAGAALLGGLAAAAPVRAQDEVIRLPFGASAVVLPVQSARPASGGDWPGRAAGEEAALRAMDAELAFALAERRAAREWALPEDLRRRVRRNPMLHVDPDRVAYQGLVSPADESRQIYEPLHGELRALAALFGTRYAVLPLRLEMAAAPRGGGGDGDAADTRHGNAEGAAGGVESDDPVQRACPGATTPLRAELLIALIDVRRSALVWHGSVTGPAGCPDSGGLLAGLAAAVARHLTES